MPISWVNCSTYPSGQFHLSFSYNNFQQPPTLPTGLICYPYCSIRCRRTHSMRTVSIPQSAHNHWMVQHVSTAISQCDFNEVSLTSRSRYTTCWVYKHDFASFGFWCTQKFVLCQFQDVVYLNSEVIINNNIFNTTLKIVYFS